VRDGRAASDEQVLMPDAVLKIGVMHPELGFADKVQWELLMTELARIAGCSMLLLRSRWES
jgi:hypothetical protein